MISASSRRPSAKLVSRSAAVGVLRHLDRVRGHAAPRAPRRPPDLGAEERSEVHDQAARMTSGAGRRSPPPRPWRPPRGSASPAARVLAADLRIDRPVTRRPTSATFSPRSRRAARGSRAWARADEVAGVWPGDHVLEQRAIGDGPRHGALVAVLVQVEGCLLGHPSERRLEAHDAVERRRECGSSRRCPSRSPACRAAGQGRAGPARRAAQRELGVPRVARDAPGASA